MKNKIKTKNQDRYDKTFRPQIQEGKEKRYQNRLVDFPKGLSHVLRYQEKRI